MSSPQPVPARIGMQDRERDAVQHEALIPAGRDATRIRHSASELVEKAVVERIGYPVPGLERPPGPRTARSTLGQPPR